MPRTFAVVAVLTLGLGLWGLSGCVDLPESGPVVPDYKADVRLINTDPAVASATLNIGAFPTGTAAVVFDYSARANYGAATVYQTLPAGAKLMYVSGDYDTSSITLESERRATVLVAPRVDSAGSHLMRLYDRYTFAVPGTTAGAAVRFVNVLASKETVDVYVQRSIGDTVAVNNLRFRRESAFVTVPTGGSRTFYVSRYTRRDSLGAPVTIVGEPNRQYTVLVHDSLSRVLVTRVEDN